MESDSKAGELKGWLADKGSVAVAFSGGVDSTFLLKMAKEALGENVLAVTVKAETFPEREIEEAINFCSREQIRQIVCPFSPFSLDGFAQNPPNRCYICKKGIFQQILAIAEGEGISCVAEGSNLDDLGDYRPGLQAVEELGIRSPLREAGMTKEQIRRCSKDCGLPTWDKPSYACLASRFAYGEAITAGKLAKVERAEKLLMELGFRQMRVRVHGNLARIEILPEQLERLLQERESIGRQFLEYGFDYVTLDLKGYRTGSMNEVLLKQI